jgi:hypothetical protein
MLKRKGKKSKTGTTNKKVFMAVVLIFLGVMFLAYNLGLISDEMVVYWPVILVIFGLWVLSSGE